MRIDITTVTLEFGPDFANLSDEALAQSEASSGSQSSVAAGFSLRKWRNLKVAATELV